MLYFFRIFIICEAATTMSTEIRCPWLFLMLRDKTVSIKYLAIAIPILYHIFHFSEAVTWGSPVKHAV